MEEWEKWKDVVDSIFEQTEDSRQKMRDHYNMFIGKIWDEAKLSPTDSKITFNLLFEIIEAQAPLLTDNNPIPTVVPKHDFLEKLAERYNMGVKYLWDSLEMQMQTYKALIYAMAKKIGIFKVYFDPSKGMNGELACDIVDPEDFFIAPGYDDEWRAPFCGVKTVRPLSWIRKTFPDVEEVKADSSIFKEEEKKNAYKYQDAKDFELDVRFATVYEVFIRNDSFKADFEEFERLDASERTERLDEEKPYGRYIYFTADTYLGEEAATDMHGLPPYVTLRDYIDPSGFLGMDEVDQTEGLIKELNLLLQNIVKYMHNYLQPSYEYDLTLGGPDEDVIQERLFDGGQIFSKRGDGTDRKMLTSIFEPQQNPTIQGMFMLIPEIVEGISGITDVTKGEPSKKQRQSASEIAILLESSHTRIRQKVRNLEWSIKRICYLFVMLMQQYYEEPRGMYDKTDEGYVYGKLSNSRGFAEDMIASPSAVAKGKQIEAGDRKKNKLEPGEWEAYQDYKNFAEAFGDKDPVYFDFDIQIDTNSTLPLDKQTLANLVIRLAQMKIVDPQAVLETLKFPNWQEIIERMKQAEGAQGGPSGPPGERSSERGSGPPSERG